MSDDKKTKVSAKQILPYIEAIVPLVKSIRENVESMPNCSRKTSLLVTLEALDKKVKVTSKEISEEQATAYLNKHPELLQKFAHIARSDENLKEAALEVTKDENVTLEDEPKQEKKKKRF